MIIVLLAPPGGRPRCSTLVPVGGGYAGTVVINREGADGCGSFGMTVEGGRPAVTVDRRTGYSFFDAQGQYSKEACRAGTGALAPVVLGTTGDIVTARAFFNGWGYVHLYRSGTGKLAELDTYAIPEAMDPRFASGFGALSVHEVATSQRRRDLIYSSSYYAGGLRVLRIEKGKLREVGAFIDQGGNDLWGVEVFQRGGKEYVAASDRDYGLYIFRYTGRS